MVIQEKKFFFGSKKSGRVQDYVETYRKDRSYSWYTSQEFQEESMVGRIFGDLDGWSGTGVRWSARKVSWCLR